VWSQLQISSYSSCRQLCCQTCEALHFQTACCLVKCFLVEWAVRGFVGRFCACSCRLLLRHWAVEQPLRLKPLVQGIK
jgi:hypothetical protein